MSNQLHKYMSMAPLEIKPKFQVTVLVLGSMGDSTAKEPMEEMMQEQVLCSLALGHSSIQLVLTCKEMCFPSEGLAQNICSLKLHVSTALGSPSRNLWAKH